MEDKMKAAKFSGTIVFVMLVCLAVSCVSLQDRTLTPGERQQIEIAGVVHTEFTGIQILHIYNANAIKIKAYTTLLDMAQKKYGNDVTVQNIVIGGSWSIWEIFPVIVPGSFLFAPAWMNVQKITVSGDVVRTNHNGRNMGSTPVERAINKAVGQLINQLPGNVSIAVLSISATDDSQARMVIDELEFLLVDSRRFKMVDRQTLDAIRQEQHFQMSGDVSDESAVSIGKLIGANIVFTGSITGNGSTQRLMLKVLDVQSGQIVAMAREQIN
jgi:hypothetical protein